MINHPYTQNISHQFNKHNMVDQMYFIVTYMVNLVCNNIDVLEGLSLKWDDFLD